MTRTPPLLDKFLNRTIMVLLAVLFVVAFFQAMDGSSRSSRYQRSAGMDTSGLISVMNMPCVGIEPTLGFLKACRGEGFGADPTDCPKERPSFIRYEPPIVSMADLMIDMLEKRQQSGLCSSPMANIDTPAAPGEDGILIPGNPYTGWSEHQSEKLKQAIENLENKTEEKDTSNDQN